MALTSAKSSAPDRCERVLQGVEDHLDDAAELTSMRAGTHERPDADAHRRESVTGPEGVRNLVRDEADRFLLDGRREQHQRPIHVCQARRLTQDLGRCRSDGHALTGSSEDAEDLRGFVAGAAEPVRQLGVECGDVVVRPDRHVVDQDGPRRFSAWI